MALPGPSEIHSHVPPNMDDVGTTTLFKLDAVQLTECRLPLGDVFVTEPPVIGRPAEAVKLRLEQTSRHPLAAVPDVDRSGSPSK